MRQNRSLNIFAPARSDHRLKQLNPAITEVARFKLRAPLLQSIQNGCPALRRGLCRLNSRNRTVTVIPEILKKELRMLVNIVVQNLGMESDGATHDFDDIVSAMAARHKPKSLTEIVRKVEDHIRAGFCFEKAQIGKKLFQRIPFRRHFCNGEQLPRQFSNFTRVGKPLLLIEPTCSRAKMLCKRLVAQEPLPGREKASCDMLCQLPVVEARHGSPRCGAFRDVGFKIEKEPRPHDHRQAALGRGVMSARQEILPDLLVLREHVEHLILGESVARRSQVTEPAADQQRPVVRFKRQPCEQRGDDALDALAKQAIRGRQTGRPAPRLLKGQL